MVDFILGSFSPFIIGMVMRYASQKWDRPLLITICLIFAVMGISVIASAIDCTFIVHLEIRVRLFACMLFGALIADLIHRIRRQRKE